MERGSRPVPQRPAFGLSHDAWGRLVLIDGEGVRHVDVAPIRAFPLTDPGRWITLCDVDGRELAHVEDLADLPSPTRRVLEEELARRDFIPVVQRIFRVVPETPPNDWEILTDRGVTRLSLDDEDEIRRVGPNRFLITDTRGVRFLIPDLLALDAASRRLFERYV